MKRIAQTLIDIIGHYRELSLTPESSKWPGVRLGLPGSFAFGPALAIGGIPTEIQRNTIASIRLGLPS
jgi:hypothetical protein